MQLVQRTCTAAIGNSNTLSFFFADGTKIGRSYIDGVLTFDNPKDIFRRPTALVTTVADNEASFGPRDVDRARRARRLQEVLQERGGAGGDEFQGRRSERIASKRALKAAKRAVECRAVDAVRHKMCLAAMRVQQGPNEREAIMTELRQMSTKSVFEPVPIDGIIFSGLTPMGTGSKTLYCGRGSNPQPSTL
jgi:hypothetical protein